MGTIQPILSGATLARRFDLFLIRLWQFHGDDDAVNFGGDRGGGPAAVLGLDCGGGFCGCCARLGGVGVAVARLVGGFWGIGFFGLVSERGLVLRIGRWGLDALNAAKS